MALSGQMMVLFVVLHLLGNSTIYSAGWLNAYAARLQAFPLLVWPFRIWMLGMLCLHAVIGLQLTIENRRDRPGRYAVRNHRAATFASKTMIWTGLAIATFLTYHLLHFTVQMIQPGLAALRTFDEAGRPDVYRMVVLGFQRTAQVVLYLVALGAVMLHLLHGLQSSLQSLGLSSEQALPRIVWAGRAAAVLIALGYAAIPLAAGLGLLGRPIP